LSEIAPAVPISYTIHQPVALRDFSSGDRIGLWTLERKRVLALSGIGNPYSFEYMLQKLGAEVISARFPDHHYYREDEIAALLGTMPGNINAIITTAKDAVRLPREIKAEAPIRILEIRLARLSGTFAKVDDIGELLEETFHWLHPPR
jgi:tetraacyldisaccharide 4'-kinase